MIDAGQIAGVKRPRPGLVLMQRKALDAAVNGAKRKRCRRGQPKTNGSPGAEKNCRPGQAEVDC